MLQLSFSNGAGHLGVIGGEGVGAFHRQIFHINFTFYQIKVINPSAHGMYEDGIDKICKIIHDNGVKLFFIPWLIYVFMVIIIVMVIIIMYVNNCPKNFVFCIIDFLGRSSF
ncbi:uncharacterized protein LOC111311921 [Durio zibethinus]|uniref:Uncharacterized protein LOC111311921 n=1 Tax=Durio zibethinus TaxID=66656 RepID=A0A6P6ARR2_DURZI|nr:uncharacterized protein LOC111311921 [Durio zibethinus]